MNKSMHHSRDEISLFVGDLPHDCSDEKLRTLFQAKFKSVTRVQIIRNEDGSSRGFGFVRFEDGADFQAALGQEMKIGNNTLRLDAAHRPHKNANRHRYNSFNSTGSNNSNNHHHHHHNQPHYHHNPHHHQQHHPQSQLHRHPQQQQVGSQHQLQYSQKSQQNQDTPKTHIQEHTMGGQHNLSQQQTSSSNIGARNNTNPHVGPLASSSVPIEHQQQQQHNTLSSNHNIYNTTQPKNNQQSQTPDNKGSKPTLPLGGDDASQSQSHGQPQPTHPQQPQPQPSQQSQPHAQHGLQPVNNNNIGLAVPSANIAATTTTASQMSGDGLNHSSDAVPNNRHNLNASQQAMGPDLRGYAQATMMDTSHLMGATEQPSIVPPTSVYGHLYPYAPPPFGYMPPPSQPNPVIPISAVPPAPPNQASPSSGLNQQHSLTASSAARYNSAQHHHQQQHAHAAADAGGISNLAGGVQPQGPFYYYYPSPLYFDQSGGAATAAAGPPNLYHPQTFHPQFFALPNPAYMSNAHTYNQPPTAAPSDAPVMNPQQPPQQQQQQTQQQSYQPQVNLRTRDIDTTIE